MRFLNLLLLRCASWLRRRLRKQITETNSDKTTTPGLLAPEELVTRFIFSDKKIRKSQLRPKPAAFDPPSDRKLSVVHSTHLPDSEIWAIGKQVLGSGPGREKICARADVPVQSILDVELQAIRDDKPFERHTSVVGWPTGSDEDATKALWKQITLQLSEDPRVVVFLASKSTA